MLAQKPNGVRAEREEQQRARDHRRGFGYRHRCDSIRRNPAAVASCSSCILDMSRGVEGAMSACRVTQISKGGAIDRGGVTNSQNQLVSHAERVRRSARCEIDPNVILAIAVRLVCVLAFIDRRPGKYARSAHDGKTELVDIEAVVKIEVEFRNILAAAQVRIAQDEIHGPISVVVEGRRDPSERTRNRRCSATEFLVESKSERGESLRAPPSRREEQYQPLNQPRRFFQVLRLITRSTNPGASYIQAEQRRTFYPILGQLHSLLGRVWRRNQRSGTGVSPVCSRKAGASAKNWPQENTRNTKKGFVSLRTLRSFAASP